MNKTNVFFLASLALVFASCGDNNKKDKSEQQTMASKVETFTLKKQEVQPDFTLPAELTGFKQVDLVAKVSSYVKSLKVDIGSEVKQGQLLIELEAPEISSQLAAALSRFHTQEANYTASKGTYQRLLETSKVEGTISKNDLEIAKSKMNADFSQLQAAKANHKDIQVMQGYLQIRAPFDGKISARNVNEGAFVGQGAQTPLLTVLDQRKLRLVISVPEAMTGSLKMGDGLTFKVNSMDDKIHKATISRMAGALDLRLRSERVELDIENNDGSLLPGMVAEVTIPIKQKASSFIVPKSAVVTASVSDSAYVFKVENSLAKKSNIQLGKEVNDSFEVFSNQLEDNDKLLLKADDKITNGMKIE